MAVNVAVAWLGAVGASIAVDAQTPAWAVLGALMLSGLVVSEGWRTAGRAAMLWLPFAVLLLLVHGLLNRQFDALDSPIPVRPEGLAYAANLSLRLAGPMCAGALFMQAGRRGLRGSVLPLVLGRAGTFVLLLATAQLSTIARRVSAVRDAQRARGVRLGPEVWTRIKALPAMVVPVTMATLLEAEERALYLENRGLTETPSHRQDPGPSSVTVMATGFAIAPILTVVVAECLGK